MRAQPCSGDCVSYATGSYSRRYSTYSRVLVLTLVISMCCCCSAARLPPDTRVHSMTSLGAKQAAPFWLQSITSSDMASTQPETVGRQASAGAAPLLQAHHQSGAAMDDTTEAEEQWSVLAVTATGGLRSLKAEPSPTGADKSPPVNASSTAAQPPADKQAAAKPASAQQAAAKPSSADEDESEARAFMLRAMPDEELLGLHNFNGALIAVDEQGNYSYTQASHTQKVLMVYRASEGQYTFPQILMVELHPHTFEPITEAGITVLTYRGRHEDPRLFTWNGRLWMSTTTVRWKIAGKVAVNLIEGKTAGPPILLDLNDKHGRRHEKNWGFFSHNGKLQLVYSIAPLRVYAADFDTLETRLVLAQDWWDGKGPALRGGAPPLLVGNRYYLFAHSKKTYEVYVVVLDAISLRVVAYSPEPVIRKGKDRILFPCGALYTPATQRFAISMGINDKTIGIVQVTKRHVDQHLVQVP